MTTRAPGEARGGRDRDRGGGPSRPEGTRQPAALAAEGSNGAGTPPGEGDREVLILRAQAERESQILKAQGEGQAIQTVFQAIHDGAPDQALLAYQYLQMMPKIAEGDANKVWVVPSEITRALEGLGSAVHQAAGIPQHSGGPRVRVDMGASEPAMPRSDESLSSANEAVREAIAAAEASAGVPGPAGSASGASAPSGSPSGEDAGGQAPPEPPAE